MTYDGARVATEKNLAIDIKIAGLVRLVERTAGAWDRQRNSPGLVFLHSYLDAAESILKELREALPARPQD